MKIKLIPISENAQNCCESAEVSSKQEVSREYSRLCHTPLDFRYQHRRLGRFMLTEEQGALVFKIGQLFKGFHSEVASLPDFSYDEAVRQIPKAKSEGLLCHSMRVNYNSDEFNNSEVFNIDSAEKYDIMVFLFRITRGAFSIEIITGGPSYSKSGDVLNNESIAYSFFPLGDCEGYEQETRLLSCRQVELLKTIQRHLMNIPSFQSCQLKKANGMSGDPLPTVEKLESSHLATLKYAGGKYMNIFVAYQGELNLLNFLLDLFPQIQAVSNRFFPSGEVLVKNIGKTNRLNCPRVNEGT